MGISNIHKCLYRYLVGVFFNHFCQLGGTNGDGGSFGGNVVDESWGGNNGGIIDISGDGGDGGCIGPGCGGGDGGIIGGDGGCGGGGCGDGSGIFQPQVLNGKILYQ